MSVHALIGQVAFDTSGRRDLAVADLYDRLHGKTRWAGRGIEIIEVRVTKLGANVLSFSVRFQNEADRNDIITRLEAVLTGQRTPLPGSWYQPHLCFNDEVETEGRKYSFFSCSSLAADRPCILGDARTW